MTICAPETFFEAKSLATFERCLFFQHIDRHSLLNLAFFKDPSDISMLAYRNPLRNSDNLDIEFALVASSTKLLSTRLVKQYSKLNAEKALEMAGNLSRTCPIEVRSDVNT